jgi:cytoskeletal protein RodZ
MQQLRDSSQRTEDNLTRLISGVDRLAQELPKRIAAATAANHREEPSAEETEIPAPRREKVRRRSSSSQRTLLLWVAVAAVSLLGLAVWKFFPTPRRTEAAPVVAAGKSPTPAPADSGLPAKPTAGADTRTRLLAAQQYADRKDYAMAEDIYKQIVASEPNNTEALKALASVLYREDKLAESAAVLDKIR